jgi:hypothetical protein
VPDAPRRRPPPSEGKIPDPLRLSSLKPQACPRTNAPRQRDPGPQPFGGDVTPGGASEGADEALSEMPQLDAAGNVAWGDVEVLRLWSQSKGQGKLFDLLTQGVPVTEGHFVLRPDQYVNIRAAISAAVGD